MNNLVIEDQVVHFVQLEIHKEAFSFSAGHFTIFSATERETLHGHNYNVSVAFKVKIDQNGLAFDYRYYKKIILALCAQLNRHMLLPRHSAFLKLKEDDYYWQVVFNHQKMFFLKEDVIILPLKNITIEELSNWFLDNLLLNKESFSEHNIEGVLIKVFNSPHQSASASWNID